MKINLNIIDTPTHYYEFLEKNEENYRAVNSCYNIYLYIDVLRATSTILSILNNNTKDIEIFKTKEFALEKYSKLNKQESVLLFGEENSIKPIGFFGGNSPLEYHNNPSLKNKTILFTSTNGAKIIANDKFQGKYFDFIDFPNSERYILSFLNFTIMINLVENLYNEKAKNYEYFNINLICGGENNNISIEDSVCAIYFSQKLKEKLNLEITINHSKESEIIFNNLETSDILIKTSKLNENIFEYIRRNSTHIKRLIVLNCEKDIDFCLKIDKINIITKVVGNKIFKILSI